MRRRQGPSRTWEQQLQLILMESGSQNHASTWPRPESLPISPAWPCTEHSSPHPETTSSLKLTTLHPSPLCHQTSLSRVPCLLPGLSCLPANSGASPQILSHHSPQPPFPPPPPRSIQSISLSTPSPHLTAHCHGVSQACPHRGVGRRCVVSYMK